MSTTAGAEELMVDIRLSVQAVVRYSLTHVSQFVLSSSDLLQRLGQACCPVPPPCWSNGAESSRLFDKCVCSLMVSLFPLDRFMHGWAKVYLNAVRLQ